MKFGIKNFRIFDERGVEFDLKPISLLTGANSSGKSSLAKAFLLFEDFLSQFSKTKDFSKCVLDFSSDRLRLGNYSNVLNRTSNTDRKIVFNYEKHSDFFNLDTKVSISFKSNPNDQQGNGYFDCCEITTMDGVWLISIKMKEARDDFNIRKIKPFYDVNLKYLRKIYFDRFRPNVGYDEEHGVYYDLSNNFILNEDDQFAEENSDIISKQIYYNTLFYFENTDSFDLEKNQDPVFIDGFENKSVLSQVKRILEDSGETDILHFFSLSEENSQFRYSGSFPLDGNIDPFVEVGRTGETLGVMPAPGGGLYEIRSLVCNEQDPFNFLLSVLFELNFKSGGHKDEFSYLGTIHKAFKVFGEYISKSIMDLLSFPFVDHVLYVPSDKVSVRRLYDFGNDQDAFHRLLKEYLKTKSDFMTYSSGNYDPYLKAPVFQPGDFVNEWISRFEIGHSLKIETPAEGLGIILRLYSEEADNVGHLLADEGYGISQIVSLLLSLEICIMHGYLDRRLGSNRFILIVEEPEIHLHPKFQSLLADMFWSALLDYGILSIVETHSEYLIRKMQVIVSRFAKEESLTDEELKDKCRVAVYYFPKDGHPYEMDIRNDGKFANEFGTGFFDEAANLAFEIL